MSSNIPASHLPLGTLIDGNSLELTEVLGVGGYGVVYRAVDTTSSSLESYAVKCLLRSQVPPSRRQIHIREIALHQISSAHPGVVTLHRVIEDSTYTYIVMDYAPDHDLFTQILDHCRYIGDDTLIKHVFLQLLDAVEYCHSLGIYHRDLKPENVLCFDNGYRVAITDFGLATTEKMSEELRTGSIYHMSPECQGGEFAPNGTYSPMSNDVWSLGIILLNLVTGRNPWRMATNDDPTFQAYLRDPLGFLPSVLPISLEINDVIVRTLDVDWRERMTLRELRQALEDVDSFYSDGVVFEGSIAQCPWEAGVDIGSDLSTQQSPVTPTAPDEKLKSSWSKCSMSESDIDFANQLPIARLSQGLPWSAHGPGSALQSSQSMVLYHNTNDVPATGRPPTDSPGGSSNFSDLSSESMLKSTKGIFPNLQPSKDVTLGSFDRMGYDNIEVSSSLSSDGSYMADIPAEGELMSAFFLPSPATPIDEPIPLPSTGLYSGVVVEGNEMGSVWEYPTTEMTFASVSPPDSTSSPTMSCNAPILDISGCRGLQTLPAYTPIYPRCDKAAIFNPLNFFPNQLQLLSSGSLLQGRHLVDFHVSHTHHQTLPPPPIQACLGAQTTPACPDIQSNDNRHQKTTHLFTRHRFFPGKLFTSSVAS